MSSCRARERVVGSRELPCRRSASSSPLVYPVQRGQYNTIVEPSHYAMGSWLHILTSC